MKELNWREIWEEKQKTENETLEIMNRNWLEVDDREIKDRFDLAVCSHFL